MHTHTLQDANLEMENDTNDDTDSEHDLKVSRVQYFVIPLLRDFPTSKISLHQGDSNLSQGALVAST
jgi:hypothetical protein